MNNFGLLSPAREDRLRREYSRWRPTLKYLSETEAHVYALAIAASVLLSFYPFLIVMLSFCHHVLHWETAKDAIALALSDYVPPVGSFLQHPQNLPLRRFQLTSMLLLLVTANGVFEPLEVALNKAWGLKHNRSYVKNQLVAVGMIFMCGGLALLSLVLSRVNQAWIAGLAGQNGRAVAWIDTFLFKLAAVPISILMLFLIYWLLPNRKVDPARVAPVAIVVGLILEGLKYLNLLLWPMMNAKMQREYGVFQYSATILLWSFAGALVVLAGAGVERARRQGRRTVRWPAPHLM